MSFKGYFRELKRRRVFKSAIAYAAIAWVLVQGSVDILPVFGIPPYILQAIIIVLTLGFPAVLIFAWIYDVTPRGIRKTKKAENSLPGGNQKTRRLNMAIISLLSIAVVVILYNQFGSPDGKFQNAHMTGLTGEETPKSIAVLPFKNWSGDTDLEYVSDGMADEITTSLQEIEEFDRVVAFREALKFKHSDIGLKQISDSLGVRFILDGSMQLSGDTIRVKVQLVDGRTHDYLWTEDFTTSWDAEALFSLQAEVLRRVREKMQEDAGSDKIAVDKDLPTDNTEAYKAYLKGLYQLNKMSKQGISRSLDFFKTAIELDTNFIQGYKALAQAYLYSGLSTGVNDGRVAWNSSKRYLEKVLKLSEDPADIRWAKHRMRINAYAFEWDFDLMEKDYLAGFDDSSTLTKTLYEFNTGRFEAALNTARLRAEAYPTCGSCQVYLANALFYMGRETEAKKVLDQNFELFNDNYSFLREAALSYYNLGDYEMLEEALRRIKTTFDGSSPDIQFLTAVNHQANGNTSEEAKSVENLQEAYRNNNSGSPAWYLAKYYAHKGDLEETIAWLQRSFERRDVEMIWLRTEPLFAPVRNDSRYLEIYKEVGFPVPPPIVPEGVPIPIR